MENRSTRGLQGSEERASLRLAFYGDDFSGSTDVMESLAMAGVPTVLFLQPPTAEQLARFPHAEAVGLAGISRSLPTERMEEELRPAFEALRQLDSPIVHYKICSTFDSSPQIGSIGRAIDVGREVFTAASVPMVVGAPVLGRYCAFGNLFARSGGDSPVYRLDRHPTMSRHPVTPMQESDLRRHLGAQTACRIELFDVVQLGAAPDAMEQRWRELSSAGAEVVLFDTLTDEHLAAIGRLLWQQAPQRPPLFVVGSSGVEYALTAHWRRQGSTTPPDPTPRLKPVEPLLIVSGSCSPVTQRQIETSLASGAAEIPLPPEAWQDEAALEDITLQACRWIDQGRSAIVHASKGPEDPRIAAVRQRLETDQLGSGGSAAARLGPVLGTIVHRVVQPTGLRRVVVTGGDTSGYVARELGIESLEFVAPVAPGSPLCRIHAPSDSTIDGLEILFKGGQVGKASLFDEVQGCT